ncbi:hypothetical protein NQ315_004953 [Exocentrus adspersus]|uniref:Protein kinase domain-containing protein n=1 Tax=Exocentrus adspersus TaxID=1586481 RepID=A0AAV8W3S2_9CUCU|nr:hypothetical protein NQ315_004953 [Exocentrus adspersus]
MVLSKRQRIEILILFGCGDKIRSQAEVCALFNAKYPENQIWQGTVSKIFHKSEEHGTIHDLPRTRRARALNEEKKLDIALELLENPHTSTVSLARNQDAPRTTNPRFLQQEKYHPYKLCEGGPATDLINGLLVKNRRIAEEHIAYILKEVTKAIIYLHENKVVHRDVRGSNILLTREGEVKLCDFGLSRKLRSKDQKLFTRLGSCCWMAPELASANQSKNDAYYDNRIDVWALGITAIELGEGKAPFQDMHPTRAMFQIITNPPPSLQKLTYWSEYYHDFISECLVKYFEYRPYIMEVIDHPFLGQIPENNYHLSLEIKSLLADVDKLDLCRPTEVIVNENCIKKGVDGDLEPMYEEDLAVLPAPTENNVLFLLEKRLEMGECYSFIGDILLYLNPNEARDNYGKNRNDLSLSEK